MKPYIAAAKIHLSLFLSAYFKLAVIMIIVFVSTDGSFDRFYELGSSENPIRNRLIFLVVAGLSLYVVIAVSFIDSRTPRFFYATIVSISTFSALAYKAITGSALSYGSLYSLWIDRDDWKSALLNYWQIALPSVGIALFFWAVMVWTVYLPLKKRTPIRIAKYFFVAPVIIIALMVGKKGGAAVIGLPVQVQTPAMLAHIAYFDTINDFDRVRTSVGIFPQTNINKPNLVLIIDESVRGDFLSINNPAAKTTPFLESQSARLANFGYASTSHDCSHYANANLRYGMKSTRPSDTLHTNPSIWEYAKKAGYHTTYLDAQRRHGQMQNFMSPKERRLIDEFVQFDNIDAVERSDLFVRKDLKAADFIKSILQKTEPQFVVVNKEGVHAPYEGKYPESEAKFFPKMSLQDSITLALPREKLINSYRNAISWGVDGFFRHLLSNETSLKNTVLFYTGDHGQNLLNEGIPTHCGSQNPPNVVGLVPLFVLTDEPDIFIELQVAAKQNSHKGSHFNVFPTILRYMGYIKSQYSDKYDNDLTDHLNGDRVWFTGDILSGSMIKHDFHFEPLEAEPH